LAKNPNTLPLNEAIKIIHPLNLDKVYKYDAWFISRG
jgi:hypothetical protein